MKRFSLKKDVFAGKARAAAVLAVSAAVLTSCAVTKQQSGPVMEDFAGYPVIAPPAITLRSEEGLTPEDTLKAALQMKSAGNATGAERLLKGLVERLPGTLWAQRASFVLGVTALESKKPNAEVYLAKSLKLKQVENYSLYYLAVAKRRAKDLDAAAALYAAAIQNNPGSALTPLALFERGAALAEAGRLVEARDSLNGFIKSYPNHSLMPEALYKNAELSLSLNDPEAALSALKRIMTRYPSNAADKKAHALSNEIKAAGVGFKGLSVQERRERGKRLIDAGRYADAAKEFSQLIKCQNETAAGDAAVQLAVAQIKLKRFDNAEKTLIEYLKRSPAAKNEAEALYWLANAASRQENLTALIKAQNRLEEKFPDSPELAGVLLISGRFFENAGDNAKANSYYRRIMNEFAKTPSAIEARWKAGWAEYSSGRYEEARAIFASSLEAGVKSARVRQQILYWKARSAEKTGNISEAAEAYVQTCDIDKKSYYCNISEERLASLPQPASANTYASSSAAPDAPELNAETLTDDAANPEKEGIEIYSESRYLTAAELIILGQGSKAAAELGLLADEHKDDRTALMEIGGLLHDAGDYARSLAVYRRLQGNGNGLSPAACVLLDELGYPMRLIETIRQSAPDGPADPFLVAAIMREESGFNPEAVSPAGALGLMQIMPSTGEAAAGETGMEYSGSKDLLKPEVSIRLGSWYLGKVSRMSGNDLVMTIASYNAGPQAASRWINGKPLEIDEFIENIPYAETRYYVKRVLRTYAEYLKLAGLDPKNRWTRPLATSAPKTDKTSQPEGAKAPVNISSAETAK